MSHPIQNVIIREDGVKNKLRANKYVFHCFFLNLFI
jgi:hypothetical protein